MMKLMIASDIHGASSCCRKMLEAFEREQADRLLLLGDILYHGPRNDLPEDYDPKAAIALLNGLRQKPLCVRGNCDTEVDQMVLEFPVMADYALIEADGYTIFATHGHLYNPMHLPPLKQGDILLCGHTHVPTWEDCGEYRYYNPGSVSIPKEGSGRSYMMLENGVFSWKTLDGEEYHRVCC